MNLRKLQIKDAPLMLEWMHDRSMIDKLQTDFETRTLKDCENFIKSAQSMSNNIHLAITNDNNVYMGTVSLKHISSHSAEFAIIVRKNAIGKGFAQYGMSEIMNIALNKLNLSYVYWCVSPENKRACRFYEKQGYMRFDINEDSFLLTDLCKRQESYTLDQILNYYWYIFYKKV